MSFDHGDKDSEKRSELHPAGSYGSPAPGTSGNPGIPSSYASPVASLQTWVNGFNAPNGSGPSGSTSGIPGNTDVKTESPVAGSSPGASLAGAPEGASSGATSSGVSPLSATSSSPYTTAVSASHLSLHPASYATASSVSAAAVAAGQATYDPSLASAYYPGYYHPSASALTSMDPAASYYSSPTGM